MLRQITVITQLSRHKFVYILLVAALNIDKYINNNVKNNNESWEVGSVVSKSNRDES